MDNVTHALVGFFVAELAVRERERRGQVCAHWARPAYFTSALANNLPDLDFAYAGITQGPLGYLLHHRGHTHTLALAPLMAALTFGAGLWWLSRSPSSTRSDRVWLGALALVGPVLHIAMDFSNNYGVHPFWPLDNRWVYGDAIFIVEPLFWAFMLPALLAQVRWRPGKIVLALLLAATVTLPWVSGLVPALISALVVVAAVVASLVSWRLTAQRRGWFALAGCLAVLALFLVASRSARSRASAELVRRFPEAIVEDLALTPLPANPMCWSLLAIQTEGDRYIVRRGVVALLPSVLAAAECPTRHHGATSAPLRPVPLQESGELELSGQFEAPLAELRGLFSEHCGVAALLRFTRAPYWKQDDGFLIAGDIRYDRSPALEFAELRLPREPGRCPRFVPSWRPPRAALLERD